VLHDEALTVIGQRLRVDSWTAEAIVALRARGIRAVLLKGPAVACWLYRDDPHARPYADADLLVAPNHRPVAGDVLRRLGYVSYGEPVLAVDEPHARHFHRPADGAFVDLHRVIHCTEHLATQRVWNALSAGTQTLGVAGVEVEIPSAAVRALHLVLHLSWYDGPESQPWRDLQRALQVVDSQTWDDAAAIARSLGIEAWFGARLHRLLEARELVRTLALPHEHASIDVWLAPGSAVGIPGVGSLMRLAAQQGRRAQLAYLRAKLFPPAEFLLERRQSARSEPIAAARARIAWLARCVTGLPRAIRAWRQLSSAR
jgi:hypothetical protein